MPGAPPPEPTSTSGPSNRSTRSRPRSESSRSIARACFMSVSAVRPGVETTAASQASSREDDDVAIRLRPFARALDAVELLEPFVHYLAFRGGHRLEQHALASRGALRYAQRDPLEGRAAAIAVAGCVHGHGLARRAAPRESGVRDVLSRVDRLAVLPDQQPEIAARARCEDAGLVLPHVHARADAHRHDDVLDELA